MPQPRSTTRAPASKPAARSTAKRTATTKASAAAKRGENSKRGATANAGAKRTTARSAASSKGDGAGKTTNGARATKRASTTKRTTAAGRTAAKRSTTRRPSASAPSRTAARATRPDELIVAAVTAVRDNLTRGIVLTGERLQEAFDDSVRRGRITRDDAEELAQSLIDIGRKQSQELISELETLMSRGTVRDAARSARKVAIKNVESTAKRAQRSPVADRALREVDRARRATGLATFPITGYDQLTVKQVTSRLASLDAPALRKVRDYERRHANRKAVINTIEKQLSR